MKTHALRQVVCGLFALKVMYPSRVFLVRGNHEFQDVSEGMDDGASGHGSFRQAVQRRLPAEWQSVYTAVFQAFEMLPLAAMLENKILVLHGGLGAAYRYPCDKPEPRWPTQTPTDHR